MEGRLSQWIERYGLWILIAVGLLVLIPGSIQMPLLDRDEPRFSQATAEMMDRSDWVIPYFNGDYRFDKPPLTYWWMRVHYWVFGKTEIGARLHSVWSTLLVAVGMWLFADRHLNRKVGWLAAFMWLTCFQVFQHGRLALADMPMITAVFYAAWAFYELSDPSADPKRNRKWFWILYGSLGLGFLAKGPIALATPILTVILFRLVFWRKPVAWKQIRPVTGSVIVLVMVAAWGIPALIKTNGLFWEIGMGKHVIDRGVEAFNDRKVLPFYYFATIFISLFPWVAFLGKRLWNIRSSWDKSSAFLVSWSISPYIIFLFYSTQLPHYVLPAFPALILWMAHSLESSGQKWGKLGHIWFWTYVIFFEILLTLALIWLLGSDLAINHLKWGMAAVIGLLIILNTMVVVAKVRLWWFMVPLLVSITILQVILGREMRALSPVIPIARMVEQLPEDTRLVGVEFEEPSLVFYTGRVWDFKIDREDLLEDLRSDQGRNTFYVVLKHEQIVDQMVSESWGAPPAEFRKELGLDLKSAASDTHVVLTQKGLNFARMRWSEILILFPKDLHPSA